MFGDALPYVGDEWTLHGEVSRELLQEVCDLTVHVHDAHMCIDGIFQETTQLQGVLFRWENNEFLHV